jgi:hypothetical protein
MPQLVEQVTPPRGPRRLGAGSSDELLDVGQPGRPQPGRLLVRIHGREARTVMSVGATQLGTNIR